MKQTFSDAKLAAVLSNLGNSDVALSLQPSFVRAPVHVVYGGANLFRAETPRKLGKLALKSLETYAPDAAEFAGIFRFSDNENSFSETIYQRTIEKLTNLPIEDFRIDYEDGYGIRADAEEDAHSIAASDELAKSFLENTITPFCGFRIKSLQAETRRRAVRTLDLFLTNLINKTDGRLPANFVVTLPKITSAEEVAALADLLTEFETQRNLEKDAIKIETMIETPASIFLMSDFVRAGRGRVVSAHFGAYDYTAAFGIVAEYQNLQHEACVFARQMMQISLAPLGIRLSDSVTTEMPVPIHKGENLSDAERADNRKAVHQAWRAHFGNITRSLASGFYQSWDLHPAQLAARYAAVYAFFLKSKDSSARRLKVFLDKATQAALTGNQFDDAASAQGLLNFFKRAIDCEALTEREAQDSTGLKIEELRAASFAEIMRRRAV